MNSCSPEFVCTHRSCPLQSLKSLLGREMAGLECTGSGCLLSKYAHCTHQSVICTGEDTDMRHITSDCQTGIRTENQKSNWRLMMDKWKSSTFYVFWEVMWQSSFWQIQLWQWWFITSFHLTQNSEPVFVLSIDSPQCLEIFSLM